VLRREILLRNPRLKTLLAQLRTLTLPYGPSRCHTSVLCPQLCLQTNPDATLSGAPVGLFKK
jgi:hypothetical protein